MKRCCDGIRSASRGLPASHDASAATSYLHATRLIAEWRILLLMRRLSFFILCVLVAFPLLAEGYSFHLRVTDGRTGLLSNPQGAPSPEQLEEAAQSRVLLFERVQGANFVWLMLGWPEGTNAEYGLNEIGTSEEDADLTLAPKESGMMTARCLRAQCRIHVTDGGDRRIDVTLNEGQSADLPIDGDWDLELDR